MAVGLLSDVSLMFDHLVGHIHKWAIGMGKPISRNLPGETLSHLGVGFDMVGNT